MMLVDLRPDFLLQLVLAAVLGGVVGLEREINGKPAGFRTNLLICVGAALLTGLSLGIAQAADPLTTSADPARIAAQIVSGIGFLGAGTILQSRGAVTGLTTAATLWVVAAIGIAVGAGVYEEAIGATALVILALIVLGKGEALLIRRRHTSTLTISTEADLAALDRVQELLQQAGFQVFTEDIEKSDGGYRLVVRVSGGRRRLEQTLHLLLGAPGVRHISQI
ncbi:MAG: MgtC/SapB family protein [Longimicrobiales bacterium]